MLPTTSNPKWKEFVTGSTNFNLSNLAVKMLALRLKLQTGQDKSDESIKKSIAEAYDFFKQNEDAAAADIKTIFG